MSECIVCKNPNCTESGGRGLGSVRYQCPRCGDFILGGSADATIATELAKEPYRAALMSHTLRRACRPGEPVGPITTYSMPSYWGAGRLPTPQEQADSLVLWIGDSQPSLSAWAITPEVTIDAWIGAALPRNPGGSDGLRWLVEQLEPERLFKSQYDKGRLLAVLTMRGWERHAELKRKAITSRTAFIAMKFGDATLDQVVRDCFRPAVERTGFKLRLVTDDQPAGLIDNQMRAAILAARFVIADLTHGNQGAYWEAGFAEGLALPVIYTCEASVWTAKRTHFDTNHMVTIMWDASALDKAGEMLTATIRATGPSRPASRRATASTVCARRWARCWQRAARPRAN
jgi:hypothetical protein